MRKVFWPAVRRVALIAALAACGEKSKPAVLAPLPPDEPRSAAEAKEPPLGPAGEAPAEAPAEQGPIEVKIPPQQTSVKLVAKGTGKLAPLRYAGKAGARQAIELALDFASTETMGSDKNETVIPTMVLVGEAEAKAVDKDGRVDYAITVRGTDARAVAGAKIKPEDMKEMLSAVVGLVIGGSVAPGGAAGDVTMRLAEPSPLTAGALEMLRLTWPVLPVLPAEPVGVGAKWQTTATARLADKIVITQVTDYELVAAQGNTWSIKGKTSVSGADQEMHGGKISNIHGTGTSELTLTAGALFPTYKASLETQFTASEGDKSMVLALRLGGALTAK